MSDALFLEALAPDGSSDPGQPPAELPRQGRLVIGSSKDRASFHLTGQGVADVHCTIGRLKSGGWALKDLGSDFGTMVNGERVDATKLAEGDEILIGSRKLRVYSAATRAYPSGSPSSGGSGKEPASKPKSSAAKSSAPKGQKRAAAPASKQKAPKQKPQSARPKTRELGGYQLERPLGRGAMGDVYLAVQKSLDRKVALKVLKAELANDVTFVQRFKDEARAAARLNHPNIVTIFDVGEEGGQHFLSMEYMDGSSLEQQLKSEGPLPWREALEVIRDAAAGLVYAESSGIVHRDIKPENLMRNRDGVTKIADLGLAAQVEQEGVDAGSGKVFGTPHFLAPEAVRGAAATPSSDLYSLGATAYRILCGHTPFEGRDAREILRSALQDEAPSLTARVPGLPDAMAATVHRLLSKDPDGRHPSASVLLAEIERLRQSNGQVGGAAPMTAKSAGPPKALLIGAPLLLAAGASAFFLLGGKKDGDAPEDRFERRTEIADGATEGANGALNSGNPDAPDGDATQIADGGSSFDGEPTSTDSGAGSAEATYEYRASVAYLELSDENLAPLQRIARLRALSQAFAGTDTATKAAQEADQLEAAETSLAATEASTKASRESAVATLREAAGLAAEPFLVGAAITAVQAQPSHAEFKGDVAFIEARNNLIDEILQRGLTAGRSAMEAADSAVAEGSFEGTKSALEAFLKTAAVPTDDEAPILADERAPSSVLEYRTLVASIQSRLDGLADSRADFEATLLRKERVAVSALLSENLERDLAQLDARGAAARVKDAANKTSEEPLKTRLAERAADLEAAAAAVSALIQGWQTPGWRRRSVIDPRDGASGSVEIVGVSASGLSVADGGDSLQIPFSAWASDTRALENLFLSRLDRDWTAEEARGIATLLSVSASRETLMKLESALGASAMRVSPADSAALTAAFDVALEWAQEAQDEYPGTSVGGRAGRGLTDILEEQREGTALLTEALIARDRGEWGASSELLTRLLEERRDTWITMMLSTGGAR